MKDRARHTRHAIARIAVASILACTIGRPARADNPPAANGGPSAADVDEAKKHYARGVQLYNQKADAAARAELERAYALAPNWKVLYNLGLVDLQMNDFASALRSFERYLADGGKGLTAARQQEVVKRVALLRDQVATIEVKVNAPDAEVLLDDVAVGTAPLSTLLVVNPGHYKLGASKGGRSAESKTVNVAGGDHAVIELAIEEPAAVVVAPLPPVDTKATAQTPAGATVVQPAPIEPVPPIEPKPSVPEPPSPEEKARRERATVMWIGWGTTGALAAGAVVTGLAALGANGDLSHAKSDRATSGAELDRLSSKAHGLAAVSDVLSIGAIAAAGVSLYLTLRSEKAAPSAAATRSPTALPSRPTLSVTFGPARIAMDGTF